MTAENYIDLQNLRGMFKDFDIFCKLVDNRVDIFLEEEHKRLVGAAWIRRSNIKNIEYLKGVFNLIGESFYFYAEKHKESGLFLINKDNKINENI
jgi:hypothetical protein